MSNEERAFLSLPRYPAYICLLEVCWLLGLKLHQARILVAKGLIMPAGKLRRRKGRLFKTAYILELADDQDWLDKAKDALSRHWEQANTRKKSAKGSLANGRQKGAANLPKIGCVRQD
jgi:hypothetical protein